MWNQDANKISFKRQRRPMFRAGSAPKRQMYILSKVLCRSSWPWCEKKTLQGFPEKKIKAWQPWPRTQLENMKWRSALDQLSVSAETWPVTTAREMMCCLTASDCNSDCQVDCNVTTLPYCKPYIVSLTTWVTAEVQLERDGRGGGEPQEGGGHWLLCYFS